MEYGDLAAHAQWTNIQDRKSSLLNDFRADSMQFNELLILLGRITAHQHQLDIETSLFSIV